MRPILPLSLGLVFAAACPATRAAESYDGCAGFIDTLPAVITTQGVWCLRGDLATSMAMGAAITIDANNVTIDCNGFKLGGLAAGEGTLATGIRALERINTVVRGCNIRGFSTGVRLDGTGHVVEDNRFESNRGSAVLMTSLSGLIRRNQVLDTGPYANNLGALYGKGEIDFLDNTVDGVVGSGDSVSVSGIVAYGGEGGVVGGNRIRGLVNGHANGYTTGIDFSIYDVGTSVAKDNVIVAVPGEPGFGIYCGPFSIARDNILRGWEHLGTQGMWGCYGMDNFIVQ